ncbi:MAG: hypothetical protein WBP75_05990 [Candidatus Cybelea sp.]
MTLRKVPGVLALGLLASLVAHAALYRGEHAMGGAYHSLLVQSAIAFSAGLLAFFGALAWSGSSVAEGSVLAARLRDRLPGLLWILPSAALWYAAAEAIEPHHVPAPPAVALAGLAVASWIVLFLTRAIVGTLARAAIALLCRPFSPRAPSWSRRARLQPRRRRAPRTHRRVVRPPPIAA